jgi:predicted TIM-barrel fold metal-dependent hydrolase
MQPEPVVDAHIHVWRRADLPWLEGPPAPRIFGPYEPLRRDYPIAEYLAAARPAGVEAAVYVQANWPLERAVEEVDWVQRLNDEHGWPQAIVGTADMFDPRARETLARQREASPLLRGTRIQLHWHPDPGRSYAASPDRLLDPTFARNVAELGALGLLFELQLFPPQIADAATLIARTPQTTFVLVHAGMLESGAPEHVSPWRAGLERLAALPNVVVKLSGQGTFVQRVDEPLIGLVAETVLELFGPRRCMFGSNFPIESLWTDYAALLGAWRRCLAALDAASRRDVLSGTARRVYAI